MSANGASPSTISAPPNSSSPTPGLINLHHDITIKLNHDNYLLWKAQLIPYLCGQHLLGYVDGTTAPPPETISQTSESGETSSLPNPAYAKWIQQDQIILFTIISSLSESLMTHIVGLSTAHSVWLTLERMFSSQSKAQIMQIRYQLSTLKKGSLSVTEYFQKFKQLVDTLAAVHRPLDDFEVNSYLLAGLSSDYESVIASIQMLAAPMSLDELYGHLLTHEQRLTQLHPLPDVAAPSVNAIIAKQDKLIRPMFIVANCYFVFQGVILTIVGHGAQNLKVSSSWFLFTLSILAVLVNLFAFSQIAIKYIEISKRPDRYLYLGIYVAIYIIIFLGFAAVALVG